MGIKFNQKNRFLSSYKIQGKLIFGIIGTHTGAGATHFALLLCNYLSDYLGKKTAYVECFPHNELQYLEEMYCSKGNATSYDESFLLHRIHYYKNIKENKLAEIIGLGYDCIVLDLGIDINKMKKEFIRCDRKIAITSLAIWKVKKLEDFMAKTELIRDKIKFDFGVPLIKSKVVKNFSRENKLTMFSIPYEPDPFALSHDTIKLFQRII